MIYIRCWDIFNLGLLEEKSYDMYLTAPKLVFCMFSGCFMFAE